MKKLIVGIFLMSLTFSFFAQTNKGDRLVGGTVNFGTQFFEDQDNVTFLNLNPNYGKFIVDNFAVGINPGIGFLKIDQFTSTTASLLPFGRYYFGKPEVIQFYVDVKGGWYIERVRNQNQGGSDTDSAFQILFGPGVAFYLNENVSLDLLINYEYIGGIFEDKRLRFNFGFQIYL